MKISYKKLGSCYNRKLLPDLETVKTGIEFYSEANGKISIFKWIKNSTTIIYVNF